jgi:hypothetical protein
MYEIQSLWKELIKLLPAEIWCMILKYQFMHTVSHLEEHLRFPVLRKYENFIVFETWECAIKGHLWVIEIYARQGMTGIEYSWRNRLKNSDFI